jgi:putative ABC transport system ATP-binding protein
MNGAAVAVKAIGKRLGSKDVLRDLSFNVQRGATLGILGPSGCGKTTALRLIAGLEVPDTGEIWLADQLASSPDRLHITPRQRNVGFVFQDLALWPHMTVAGNLLFVLESRGWPAASRKDRVTEMLSVVGMIDRAQEYPSHLSGGEQQRVALARAFSNKPRVLFADEPTGNLDSDNGTRIVELIESLNREAGSTVVLVTHDLGLARRAQRVIRLADGVVISDERMGAAA